MRLSEEKEGKRDLFFLSATQELERRSRFPSLLSIPSLKDEECSGTLFSSLGERGKGSRSPFAFFIASQVNQSKRKGREAAGRDRNRG